MKRPSKGYVPEEPPAVDDTLAMVIVPGRLGYRWNIKVIPAPRVVTVSDTMALGPGPESFRPPAYSMFFEGCWSLTRRGAQRRAKRAAFLHLRAAQRRASTEVVNL